jgi:hypothetical protein
MIDVPPDLYELYAEFGYASEKAQVLEVAAGNVALAYLALFTDTDNITPEQTEFFRQIVDDINSKTFGVLLKSTKKHGTIDDNIARIVGRKAHND